jgi:hypothetical protein
MPVRVQYSAGYPRQRKALGCAYSAGHMPQSAQRMNLSPTKRLIIQWKAKCSGGQPSLAHNTHARHDVAREARAGAVAQSAHCGMVRCGAVRCGALQCGAVQCGAVRCTTVRCGAVRCGAVRCGAVRAHPSR